MHSLSWAFRSLHAADLAGLPKQVASLGQLSRLHHLVRALQIIESSSACRWAASGQVVVVDAEQLFMQESDEIRVRQRLLLDALAVELVHYERVHDSHVEKTVKESPVILLFSKRQLQRIPVIHSVGTRCSFNWSASAYLWRRS